MNSVIAAMQYTGPTRHLIASLKYEGVYQVAEVCAKLIYYSAAIPVHDLIVPVPLHPNRLFRRGFNQAEAVATELGKLTSAPCLDALQRTRHLAPQAQVKDRQERLTRLGGSFVVDVTYREQLNAATSILLVDDVFTTGATLSACAEALQTHTSAAIHGLTIAHGV